MATNVTLQLSQLTALCTRFPELPAIPADRLADALEIIPLLDRFSSLPTSLPQLLNDVSPSELTEAIALIHALHQPDADPAKVEPPETSPSTKARTEPKHITLTEDDRAKLDTLRLRRYTSKQIGDLIGTRASYIDGYFYRGSTGFMPSVVKKLRQLDIDDPNLPAPRGRKNQTIRRHQGTEEEPAEPA